MAKISNVTLNFELFKERFKWGSVFENGSVNGVLGDVSKGLFDSSAAGIYVTLERSNYVDFLPSVTHSKVGIILRRPSGNDISIRNYIDEFNGSSWSVVLTLFLVSWLSMICLIYFGLGSLSIWKSFLSGTNTVLRSFLNKVSREQS